MAARISNAAAVKQSGPEQSDQNRGEEAAWKNAVDSARKAGDDRDGQGRPKDEQPTSLLTERIGDGSANCLEDAAKDARPGRDELVFLRDERGAAGGDIDGAGHVLVRDLGSGRLRDPSADGAGSFGSLAEWADGKGVGANGGPAYSVEGSASAETVQSLLALPPEARAARIAQSSDPALKTLSSHLYADAAPLPSGEAAALKSIAGNFNELREGDASFGRGDLEDIVSDDPPGYVTDEIKTTAQYLLDHPGALDALDTAAEGGKPDGKVSDKDVGARMRSVPMNDADRSALKTLDANWDELRGNDDRVGVGDLENLIGDNPPGYANPELQQAARHLLYQPHLLSFKLDVADKGGAPDGKVSRADLDALLGEPVPGPPPVTVNVGAAHADGRANIGEAETEGATVDVSGGLWAKAGEQPVSADQLGAQPQIAHPGLVGQSMSFAHGLAAGASAQQLLGDTPSQNAISAMGDAYEMLGVSDRQIGLYADAQSRGARHLDRSSLDLQQSGAANLAAAVQIRAAVDLDGPANLLGQGEPSGGAGALPSELSASGVRSALGETADDVLFGKSGIFPDATLASVTQGAQRGRADLTNTDVSSPSESLQTGIPQPSLLTNSQLKDISRRQMTEFLKKADAAPAGSDLKIVANLHRALNVGQAEPELAGHVDVPKVQGQLQAYMLKPEVAGLLQSERSAAIETVTGKPAEEVVGGLADYITSLPKQQGFLDLLEADHTAAGNLLGNAMTQLDALDPTAAIKAQSEYQQGLFSGPNGARILRETSPENRDAAVTAALKAFGLDDATNAVQKSRFAISGVNNILKGAAGLEGSSDAVVAAARTAVQTVSDAIAGGGGEGAVADLEASVLAEAERSLAGVVDAQSQTALGMVRTLVKNGYVGGVASVLSAAAFGMEVSSAKTTPQKLATAGDFLLAVGNFPQLATAVGQLTTAGIQGAVNTAKPALARMGLATPAALAVFSASYGVAAYQSAKQGDVASAALQGTASGVVGVATIVNLPGFTKGVVDNALALARTVGQAGANVVGELELVEAGGAALAGDAAAAAAGGEAAAAVGESALSLAGAAASWDWITGPAAPWITGGALLLGAGLGFAAYFTNENYQDNKKKAEAEGLLRNGVGDGESYYKP